MRGFCRQLAMCSAITCQVSRHSSHVRRNIWAMHNSLFYFLTVSYNKRPIIIIIIITTIIIIIIFLSICLSACLPACPSIYLSACPSVRPSVHPSVRPSVYLSIYPCCSQLEHRASVKRFVPLQFLNLSVSVGLLGRGSARRKVATYRNTE
jgi:hypothetical protein